MTPKKILAWRVRHGLTQLEAATLIGVDIRSWRRWEAGDRLMTIPVSRLLVLIETVPGAYDALEAMR